MNVIPLGLLQRISLEFVTLSFNAVGRIDLYEGNNFCEQELTSIFKERNLFFERVNTPTKNENLLATFFVAQRSCVLQQFMVAYKTGDQQLVKALCGTQVDIFHPDPKVLSVFLHQQPLLYWEIVGWCAQATPAA